MIAKVLITTFSKNYNQGFVNVLGARDIEVEPIEVRPVERAGCCSGEVKGPKQILVVDLLGRKFEVEGFEDRWGQWKQYGNCKYTVSIPWELGQQLFAHCPHCGHAI